MQLTRDLGATEVRAINRIIFVSLMAWCGSTFAASFDCGQASAQTEKLICGNERLSKLDSDLGDVYRLAYEDAFPIRKRALMEEQRAWINHVRDACKGDACLQDVYTRRIDELSLVKAGGAEGRYVVDSSEYSAQVLALQKKLQNEGVNGDLTDCTRMILLTASRGLPVTRGTIPQDVYGASCKLHDRPIMVCSSTLLGHLTLKFEGAGFGSAIVDFADKNCPYGG